jgi:O-antigen/teichoic acid export membrane protein
MVRFAAPTIPFTLASYLLTTVGLVGVKAWVRDGVQVAYFSAASYLASAPRLVLVAFWLTLFPHLAGSIAAGDLHLTRTQVRSAVRYLGLVLIPATMLIVSTSSRLIPLLYPAGYGESAHLLNLLLLGTGLHVVYMVFANAIIAEGRTGLALAIPCLLTPLQLLATWHLASRTGTTGAAVASASISALAAAVAVVYVMRRFSVRLPGLSLARITLASLVPLVLTRLHTAHGLILIVQYLVLGLLYATLLVLLREVTPQEIRQLRAGLVSTAQRWQAEAQS